jgi:hypothetical protein
MVLLCTSVGAYLVATTLRAKFLAVVLGTSGVFVGFLSFRYFGVGSQDADEEDDGAAGHSEVDALRAELVALRASMGASAAPFASPMGMPPGLPVPGAIAPFGGFDGSAQADDPFQAFANFGSNVSVPGPIMSSLQPPHTSPGAYAPMAPSSATPLANAISMVTTHLQATFAAASSNPYWFTNFWPAILVWDGQGMLPLPLVALLQLHGYAGAAAGPPSVAPRANELKISLDNLRNTPTPMHGAGGGSFSAHAGLGANAATRWEDALPPDLKRAAPEIYRSLRSGGNSSVRDYLVHNFVGDKSDHLWKDLWTQAQIVDFGIGAHSQGGEQSIIHYLFNSDEAELALRRIASYVYEARTGDKAGAMVIQGVRPPGSKVDIAPTWLVSDATQHSKMEHQRDERTRAARPRGGKDGGKGKPGKDEPGGKGKPKKG